MANEIVAQNNNNNGLSGLSVGAVLINTISGDDLESRVLASNAQSDADSLKTIGIDTTFLVRNFILQVGVRSRTGELCVETYLICDDGNVYYTQSSGIAKSAKNFIDCFTDENGNFNAPCDRGYGFVVREKTLGNGNTLKTLAAVKL